MNPLLRAMLARFQAPAGDDGSDTSGTGTSPLDRGDDFLSTDDLDTDDKGEKDPKDLFASDDDKDSDDEKDPEVDEKDKTKGKREPRIPLSRHKDVLAKERAQREALETRLAQYEKGQQVARVNDDLTKIEDNILSMEKQYNTFLAEGEIDKASELMSRIRQAERQISESKAEMRAQVAEVRARETARYDIVLERIEESYPQLDQDSDEYDADMVQDVADLKSVYQNRGMTPSKALQAAVKKLLGAEDRSQRTATEVAPRVTDKDIAAERKREAVRKTADAVRRTPSSTRDVGMDSDKAGKLTPKDIMSMKQEDFAKLGEEQLAKMRGDVLA